MRRGKPHITQFFDHEDTKRHEGWAEWFWRFFIGNLLAHASQQGIIQAVCFWNGNKLKFGMEKDAVEKQENKIAVSEDGKWSRPPSISLFIFWKNQLDLIGVSVCR